MRRYSASLTCAASWCKANMHVCGEWMRRHGHMRPYKVPMQQLKCPCNACFSELECPCGAVPLSAGRRQLSCGPSVSSAHAHARADPPSSPQASARMRARKLPGPKPYYVTAEQPDMWFDAAEVWEIRGADLTISPVHKVGPGLCL